MVETRPAGRSTPLRQAIVPLVFGLAACGLVYYLFYPDGPVLRGLRIDLSFLILPSFCYFLMSLFSRLVRTFNTSPGGKLAAHLLSGLAPALFSYFFLSRVLNFTSISWLYGARGFFEALSRSAWPAVLFFTGYTAVRASRLLTIIPRSRSYFPAAAAAGQLLMGFSLWRGLAVFSPGWGAANDIGLVCLAALVGLAGSGLASYGKSSGSRFIADISGWLSKDSAFKLIFAALIAVYLIFVRPLVIRLSPSAHLFEWLVVCIVAWIIFNGIREILQAEYCAPLLEACWRKQVQQIDILGDEHFSDLVLVQELFIGDGNPSGMLAVLRQALQENHVPDNDVNQVLRPLADYHDRKIRWFLFGPLRKRIIIQNRRSRRYALDDALRNLGEIVHPGCRKV